MKRSVCFLVAAACYIVSGACQAQAEGSVRVLDPVVIKGALLGPLIGEDISRLSVFAEKDGQFGPIPFQVDEVTKCLVKHFGYQEVYAAAGMSGKCRMDTPGLDRNDELVFMAKDAGGRVASREWPGQARAGMEIQVKDPITGSKRFAYLLLFEGQTPRSGIDYVEYDPIKDIVKTPAYEMGFSEFNPMNLESISIPAANGGRGQDILDSLKIRADIILFGVFTHVLNNNDYTGRMVGYIDGPVRVIRMTGTIGEVWPFVQIRKIFISRHYPQFAEYDLYFSFPAGEGKLDLSLDMTEKARSMTFYSQNNTSGVKVDGRMSQAEKDMDYGPGEWVAIAGDQGSLLLRIDLPDESHAFPDLYYLDDDTRNDEPEEETGQTGRMGFAISPVEDLHAEKVPVTMEFFFPKGFQPVDERSCLDVKNHPLIVRVNANQSLASVPSAPLFPDSRPEGKGPIPSYEAKTMEETKTRGFLPVIQMDPNLGYGGGIAYMDRNFMRKGMKADIGGSITHRLYQSYYADIREIPWIPWIDNPQVNISFDNHPNRYYYGEGNESEMDELAVYHRDDFYIQILAEKYFAGHFGVGLMTEYHDVSVSHGEMVTGEYDSIEEHYGPDEDIIDDERWGPEIYGWGRNNTSRIQLSGFLDYRDSETYPTRGVYLKAYEDIVTPAMGADYNFTKTKLQGSFYLSPGFFNPETRYLQKPGNLGWRRKFLGPDKNRVLAFRVTVQDIEGEEIEFEGREILDVPFYELSYLGDADLMRGYYEGRRRDNDLVDFQAELRWHMYKEKFGAFLFADAGRVFEDIWEDIDEDDAMDTDNLLVTYGFGVAFTIVPEYIQCITLGFSEEEAMLAYFFGWYSFEDYPRGLLKAGKGIFW